MKSEMSEGSPDRRCAFGATASLAEARANTTRAQAEGLRYTVVFLIAMTVTLGDAGAAAQERRTGVARLDSTLDFIAGDPAVGPVVRGAPYSAEATTTVSQTLADGTRIERTTVVRVYRDGEGRVRREETVLGLGALAPAGDAPAFVTITDPVARTTYVLDPNTRTARRTIGTVVMATGDGRFVNFRIGEARAADEAKRLAAGASGEPAPPPPPPPPPPGERPATRRLETLPNYPQPIGTKQIEGVEAVGTRRVETLPVGRIGNDRPIEIVDERWESPALKVLVQSRHSDPRTGVVEYRLTNIVRAEPPRELFVVPSDYTIIDAREERR